MKQQLGLSTLVMLVVASMIGIGVFVSSGYALQSLGNPGRVLIAWLLCGLWALAGAIAYGALAKRVPLSGGEYLYLSRLMHPSIGFLAGWISLVAGFTSPIAAMAKAFVAYGFPTLTAPTRISTVASGVILIACACHAVRLSVGAFTQNAIVLIKLLFIVVLIVWAYGFTANDAWQGGTLTGHDASWWPHDVKGWTSLFAAMSWIALSYVGFNAAVYVAGESREAQTSVPRAMIGATLLVIVLYMLMNALFVFGAPSPVVIKDPEAIAMLATRSLGGAAMENWTRILVCLAVLSSVFSMLLAGPRVYMQMARDGIMPRFLSTLGDVPHWAVLMQALLSVVVVWVATLEQIIGYLGMTLSACSALTVAAIWRLNKANISAVSPKVNWLESSAAAVYIVGTMAMLAAVAVEGQRTQELWAVGGTFVFGLLIYAGWQGFQPRGKEAGA